MNSRRFGSGNNTRLRPDKYFQVRRIVSQGAKIRRARLTRHSWCVRRTLPWEITFLSAGLYGNSSVGRASVPATGSAYINLWRHRFSTCAPAPVSRTLSFPSSCLGTHLVAKLCFAWALRRPGMADRHSLIKPGWRPDLSQAQHGTYERSQVQLGNEEKAGCASLSRPTPSIQGGHMGPLQKTNYLYGRNLVLVRSTTKGRHGRALLKKTEENCRKPVRRPPRFNPVRTPCASLWLPARQAGPACRTGSRP